MHSDFDRCYRAVQAKDARFDGWYRHRGADDEDLLPAQLSGSTTVRPQRRVLPDGRGGSAGWVPRVQKMSAGRIARLAGMERPR